MPETAPGAAAPHGDYALGIDLGTTYSAAAIDRGGRVEPVVLGTIAAQIPSVVVHREDGEVLTGEAAERRSASEPTRTAREFKRRLGDPIPLVIGGTPFGAESLMAELLQSIVRHVTEREGRPPSVIVLTHPANYSEYKRGLLQESARLAGLDVDHVRFVTEPEAAAIAYAHQQRIEPGEVIAVYDFGGGTFDAAVVRAAGDSFELIGTPEGMERLGGIDFDQAVLVHVDGVLDGLVASADVSNPQVRNAQVRLRDECRRAKEALSGDTDATIPVSLPGIQTEVRLTRDELEQMVRPRIVETVRALERTITSAGLRTEQVSRVLLVGGSSRMPIVAQVIRESIGRPVSMDADPKLAIALGAALFARVHTGSESTPLAPVADDHSRPSVREPVSTGRAQVARPARRGVIVAIAGAVLGIAAVVGFSVLRNGNSTPSSRASSASSAASVTAPATAPTASSTAPATSAVSVAVAGALPGPTVGSSSGLSTGLSSKASSVVPTATAATATAAKRFAFDGSDRGANIPGPALGAGAPAEIRAIAVAPDGAVLVAAADPQILRVSRGEVVVASRFTAADVPASGVVVGSDGSVFVATPAGVVRIVDGSRALILDGPGSGLSRELGALAMDGGGNLYLADNGRSRILRRAPDGTLTLVAGTGIAARSGSAPPDGVPAATAAIGRIAGLVVDLDGNLLMADAGLRLVRAVRPDGTIHTLAGGGTVSAASIDSPTSGRPDTKPRDLTFSSLDGIAVDPSGRIAVSDRLGRVIVRMATDGHVELLVAITEGATAAGSSGPTSARSLAIAPSGAVLFTDGLALWTCG